MKLEDYKLVFIAIGLIGILLAAIPVLGSVLRLPAGEAFSELYVLGPGHMVENYPFNVAVGQNYSVYVAVGNHVGSSAYYALYVKFRSIDEPLPNATLGLPSSLSPLYEYRVLLEDGEGWESPLTFSFTDVSFSENKSTVGVLQINGVNFPVDKGTFWDADNRGFYYQLIIELWLFNPALSRMEFNNSFVGLYLNMTSSRA